MVLLLVQKTKSFVTLNTWKGIEREMVGIPSLRHVFSRRTNRRYPQTKRKVMYLTDPHFLSFLLSALFPRSYLQFHEILSPQFSTYSYFMFPKRCLAGPSSSQSYGSSIRLIVIGLPSINKSKCLFVNQYPARIYYFNFTRVSLYLVSGKN